MEIDKTPLERAVENAGSQANLAAAIGNTQQSISNWLKNSKPVPVEFALKIERATGVSRFEMRPDVFGKGV